jgi:hypothetical protein
MRPTKIYNNKIQQVVKNRNNSNKIKYKNQIKIRKTTYQLRRCKPRKVLRLKKESKFRWTKPKEDSKKTSRKKPENYDLINKI